MGRFSHISVLALALSTSCLALPASAEDVTTTKSPTATQAVPTQLPTNSRPVRYAISVVPDAANLKFDAKLTAQIEVLRTSNSITLNAADLEIHSASLMNSARQSLTPVQISLDSRNQTATFTFAKPLAPGAYRLNITYGGKINTQGNGLFALDYDSDGVKKRALYTQFEAPYARRFFPSWDEPQFRAPIELTVTVPAGQVAYSNMPEAKRGVRPDGSKVVTFATTPPMSTYLLFFAIGEFDRISKDVAGTDVGIVTLKGDVEKGRFVLDGSAEILAYFNDYFGVPYPLPKLDNVAGPGGGSFDAMENWGAIFSYERALLVDPAVTTEDRKQYIFWTAAHEIAHQWFGNLVTMAWWGDLWLNEGFATWIANKATEKLRPEWQASLKKVLDRETAMALDSVASAHPVVQDVLTVQQIEQAFDAITYQKGQAVLTMLEDYVGEDAWREGVQSYIRKYSHKNTITTDFWAEVEVAAGKPVKTVAQDFLTQPGIPLIRVEGVTCRNGNSEIVLRQDEFSRDRTDKAPLSWKVPVTASVLGRQKARTLVNGGTASLRVEGCGPFLVNSGQNGYFRTLYSTPMLDQLTSNYGSLTVVDQMGLLTDAWALGLAGYQSPVKALGMLDAIPANANEKLLNLAALIALNAYRLYYGSPENQVLLTRYASVKFSPVLDRIGWDARPGEAANVALLRSTLVAALGEMGVAHVVEEANRRYASGHGSAKSGPLRSSILKTVAINMDAEGWEKLHEEARREETPLVRRELYRALALAHDPDLADRTLAVAITDEPGKTLSYEIVAAVASVHPDLAFDFAMANREKMDLFLDQAAQTKFYPELALASRNPSMVQKLEDYAARYMTPQSRRPADISINEVKTRIAVVERSLPEITRWLQTKMR